MSGSYRLQPPSPFPYSGGSRLEQSLMPIMAGPTSNSMIGYTLGAQLQRQADQMNYDTDMAEYNLTAQQEGERARQEAADLRREQMQHNLTAAAVNSGGPGFLPESYSLTPQQRQLATADAEARTALRTAQAARVSRVGGGSSGGNTSARPDPMLLQDVRAIDQQIRTAEAALNALPSRRAQLERGLQGIFNPTARAAEQQRINEQLATEQQRLTEQLAGLRTQRSQVRTPQQPAAQPQTQTAPQASGPVQGAPASPSGEVAPVPLAQQRASTNPASVPPDQLARARALAAQTGGTPGRNGAGELVVRLPDGTVRKVD